MKHRVFVIGLTALTLAAITIAAQPRQATEKPGPRKSGFYDFYDASAEFGPGTGTLSRPACDIGPGSQPAEYAGNYLLDCDGETPHNETSIAVNPGDAGHIAGAFHTYVLNFVGATIKSFVVSTVSVSRDGGNSWHETVPPITPYQFTGDPAVAFDGDGRLYLASIADHEGPGGTYTGPSVVVASSEDGGLSWSHPVTVARGLGAVTRNQSGPLVFQDKEYIAADTGAASAFRNRVYVTWTSFQETYRAGRFLRGRSPIMVTYAADGRRWSAGAEISGASPDCLFSADNRCDSNQFSSPAVAPNGTIYVGFENFNTPAENQFMVVKSSDGGATWSGPARVGTVSDINFPFNISGRQTLTGCQFRVAAPGNIATDPGDASGQTVYAVWADNRNGSSEATNTNVFLYRSADGGATWAEHAVDIAANDQFYPWVAVAPDGRVDVGYMDRAYSSGQSVCQYGFSLTRMTFDSAGNVATRAKARVDTGLSDPGHSRWFSAATAGNSLFLGDYNGVAVGSDGTTWSLWTDHRGVVPNPPSPTRNHGQHAVAAATPK